MILTATIPDKSLTLLNEILLKTRLLNTPRELGVFGRSIPNLTRWQLTRRPNQNVVFVVFCSQILFVDFVHRFCSQIGQAL